MTAELSLGKGEFTGKEPKIFMAKLSGSVNGNRAALDLRVRRAGDTPIEMPRPTIEKDKPRECVLAVLPEGDYRIDARVLDLRGRVITWATAPFKVTSQRRVSEVNLKQD